MLCSGISSRAQDVHFSQFYENAILRNPALTGIFSDEYKVGIDYRTQWSAVATPYTTTMISGETRVLVNREVGDYLSFGLVGTFDRAGATNFATTQIYPAIAYNKALEDQHNTYLSVGLTGGYRTRSVNPNLVTTGSQWNGQFYDPNSSTGENLGDYKASNYDVGAGVSLNSSIDFDNRVNYYLGVSAYHINSPDESFNGGTASKRDIKFQFAAGIHFPLADKFSFTVHSNYSVQSPYTELLAGGLFTYKSLPPGLPSIFSFHFGAFFRSKDAIIPTFKIDYKNLSFGYSYDVTNSQLASGSGGTSANELTLYVRGSYLHRKNPRDPMMCPRFADPVDNYR